MWEIGSWAEGSWAEGAFLISEDAPIVAVSGGGGLRHHEYKKRNIVAEIEAQLEALEAKKQRIDNSDILAAYESEARLTRLQAQQAKDIKAKLAALEQQILALKERKERIRRNNNTILALSLASPFSRIAA